MIPEQGSVVGIDIGYSPKRATSAICRLDWTGSALDWTIKRYPWRDAERRETMAFVANRPILAAAFDGPFGGDLETIDAYRCAERVITRGIARFVGKPGASNSRTGRDLNKATNQTVSDFLAIASLDVASHEDAIHSKAVVEAFPNTFLGVMLPDGHGVERKRGETSDRYFMHLSECGRLDDLLRKIAGDRRTERALASVTDHDDRAALVCALSALCVVADRYVMVGDMQGRIVLPPADLWNAEILALVRANCANEGNTALIERP